MAILEPITGPAGVIFPWHTTFSVPIPTVARQSYIIKTCMAILVGFDSGITCCNLPPWTTIQQDVHQCHVFLFHCIIITTL